MCKSYDNVGQELVLRIFPHCVFCCGKKEKQRKRNKNGNKCLQRLEGDNFREQFNHTSVLLSQRTYLPFSSPVKLKKNKKQISLGVKFIIFMIDLEFTSFFWFVFLFCFIPCVFTAYQNTDKKLSVAPLLTHKCRIYRWLSPFLGCDGGQQKAL